MRVGAQPSADTPSLQVPEALQKDSQEGGSNQAPIATSLAGRTVLLLPWISGECLPRGTDFQTPQLTDTLVPHTEGYIKPLLIYLSSRPPPHRGVGPTVLCPSGLGGGGGVGGGVGWRAQGPEPSLGALGQQ